MIQDPNANFYEVKAAFYAEFGDEVGERGSGWKQFKRWEWSMEPRVESDGRMPDARLIYEEVKRAQLQKEYRGAAGNWEIIGPVDVPQNGSGNSIGRISAIAFHPTDTNHLWAGAPSGGMWESTDNGLSWEPLTDDLPNIGVSEIVVDPQHPDTMYLSTGDGSVSDTHSFGVLKSTDGGQTWDTTGLSFGVQENRNIRRLIIDKSNTDVLIAASTSGIYRTEDGGTTWGQVKSGSFVDAEFHPTNSDTVYASTFSVGTAPFYLSIDNGQSWSISTDGITTSGMDRVKIAVTPDEPDFVFLLGSNTDQGMHGLYRSEDAGVTWSLLADSPNLLGYSEFGTDEGGQGWYSMDLAVSPNDADEIKVGGINIWESTDGGNIFLLDAHWTGANGSYVHADQHKHTYHPVTGQFYAGCDGGLYRKSHFFNGYVSISSGMSITQFYRMGGSASDATIILAGAQDNGTFRWKEDLWSGVFGGDGMEAFVHPSDPFTMYCTTQGGVLHKSTDGGASFSPNIAPRDGAWVAPFMMEPGEPDVLYAALATKIYRSDDAGSDWWEFSPTLTTFNSGWLEWMDVAQSNTEYVVGASHQTLRLTKDLGGSWSNIRSGLPGQALTALAFDPLDENTIWVGFARYDEGERIYRSTDAGETWENMSMNLPDLPVNCFAIERSSAGGVYVGTAVGVYYWDRTLTEWEPYMTGLPNVRISELEIHEGTHRIRAATYGRGLWESDTRNFINVGIESEAGSELNAVTIFPNPASERIEIDFGRSTAMQFDIIDAYGRKVRSDLNPNRTKKLSIDIRGLSVGLYYLSNSQNNLLGRFIVNNQ